MSRNLTIREDEDTRDYARRVGSEVQRLAEQSGEFKVTIADIQTKQSENHERVMETLHSINNTVSVSATKIENTENSIDDLKKQDSALFKRVNTMQEDRQKASSKTNWLFIGITVAVATTILTAVAGWMITQFLASIASQVPAT